jgi:hypothetical protein
VRKHVVSLERDNKGLEGPGRVLQLQGVTVRGERYDNGYTVSLFFYLGRFTSDEGPRPTTRSVLFVQLCSFPDRFLWVSDILVLLGCRQLPCTVQFCGLANNFRCVFSLLPSRGGVSLQPLSYSPCYRQDYNIQSYILRRAREEFQASRGLPSNAVAEKLREGRETLQLIQRQSTIAGYYSAGHSVMRTPGR